jgi:RimJ/RimL family protein N-acetyltransferase
VRTPEPAVLSGSGVVLEPLTREHCPDLLDAAADPLVWRWLSVTQPTTLPAMEALVASALTEPRRVAWAVVVNGRAIGSTSYLDIDLAVDGLEVGWTWYSRQVWKTSVNPACKLLLLGHAFDELGAARVLFKTDAQNTRSRSAILRLGAQYDGTLRHHRLRSDGSVRDSAYYSILAPEWPAVRAGLLDRLAA